MAKKKKIVAIIPARMGSTRFPGKPLAMIMGLPMIEHVRRRALLSDAIDEVYVATCDQKIVDVVVEFGGKAIMTSRRHERCTDRVEEAADSIDTDYIVIVAGDEPLLHPQAINKVMEPIKKNKSTYCVNLLSVINNDYDFNSTDVVKAVMDKNGDILYFSRSPLPYLRIKTDLTLYRQTGIQAFSKAFLKRFSLLRPTPLEITESIDFLRILEHGFKIKGVVLPCDLFAVDRPQDVKKVENILSRNKVQKNYFKKINNI